ncbi:primosomal protein N' [Neisseria shayeganii]|uniref:primosomal protein N' n=1 Tax=Neisseria shayeganii TaxID=607712 RepID=UPI003CC82C7D
MRAVLFYLGTTVPYCQVALNVPLSKLFTYAVPHDLTAGTRVAVPFAGRTLAGIVWGMTDTPDVAEEKILPVKHIFAQEPPLPENWRELMAFTARYYHYPLGQTVFTALPAGLRQAKPCSVPEPPLYYALNAAGRAQTAPTHKRQAALWQALRSGSLTARAAKRLHPQAAALLAKWQAAGWLTVHADTLQWAVRPTAQTLNPQQQAAADAVVAADGFSPFLLFGITGSGKTEAYFEMMAAALARGKQVLFLLPEINLTPQLLARLQQRFADVPTAVLHSQTAAGERSQGYLKALLGQARLIVGTRLAVFTPLPDLGLVIVDEEHDASFKQDSELRYQARDLALWRAQQAGCAVVLGSATPSLESWYKAQSGRYTLLTLPERARAESRLPDIRLLDVRREALEHGFSAAAIKLLQENHAAGGMSMVYLNRRGFAPAIFCGDCGHLFGCPHCSAKMVLHQRSRQLRCHHCGHITPVPRRCPDCGNQDLTAVGFGTQRAEDLLRQAVPQAQVVRVDRDSTSRKDDWADLYRRIDAGSIDILVGTQMLAKGHDFARLNLVVVLNADGSLYSADYRAPERLFAELMQVAGRAGRAGPGGRVLIQTQLPEHRVYQALLQQDYAAFADGELAERAAYGLPPFAYAAAVRADAPLMADALAVLQQAADAVLPVLPESVQCLGPVPMLMARLAGRERAQVFLESPDRKALHRALSAWQEAVQAAAKTCAACRWSVDVDPLDM